MKIRVSKVIYNFVVVALYLVFGILLLLKYLVWQEVPDFRMGAFGIAVLGYGAFRGYRAYKDYREIDEPTHEND